MVATSTRSIILAERETRELIDWATEIDRSDATVFEKAQAIATRLGAHQRPDGLTEIGFWTPELLAQVMRPRDIYLEVLTPLEPIDPAATDRVWSFRCNRLRLQPYGQCFWGVVEGMVPGTRDRLGSFYWLRYLDQRDTLRTIRDVLAYSLPYGIFAPAELYDIASMQRQRADLAYFQATGKPASDGSTEIPRIPAPVNILQIHVGTASPEGSFAGLNRLYQRIAAKLEKNEPIAPAEQNYLDYDAIQLLPIEPTIEYLQEDSVEGEFFKIEGTGVDRGAAKFDIRLRKPNAQNWGYDIPILGASAPNPSILETLRPQELVDLIATLHNFPGKPIQVIFDLVYGHADNQSELLINRQFLKGPNMYGQDLNHQLPMVRAILLETQKRKLDFGADGIRVDGGQDFRFFNPLTGRVEQDDAYLLAMSDVVQEIDGNQRLMFTIFEDGRPWPEEGWEESSTYRELIDLMPVSFQWGPLIFAHNTPALAGFWERKWRRVCEVMFQGSNWNTGCANHDTIRRGNQIDLDKEINWNLGSTLQEVLRNAYDNPATTLWVYGFSPGLPMDFINALGRTPWMFFRNTDERYGVKVVSEEFGFLDWQVSSDLYDRDNLFLGLKELGFQHLSQLQEFGRALSAAMIEKNYYLPDVVRACQLCFGEDTEACDFELMKKINRPDMVRFLKELDITKLKLFALTFMEDCYAACNTSLYEERLDPVQVKYNASLRRFRHDRPWLQGNLQGLDRFNKVSENGATLFYGVRRNPDNENDRVAMVTHMGGNPTTVTLGDWLQLDLTDWEIAIASPSLADSDELKDLRYFQLRDSQGLLLSFRQPS